MTRELTTKELKFCMEYLLHLDVGAAYTKAGYTGKRPSTAGGRMLKKPAVKEFLDKEMARRAERVDLNSDYILQGIKNIADDEGAKNVDKLKAYELLGKHLRLFTDKVEHSGDLQIRVDVDSLDDEEES